MFNSSNPRKDIYYKQAKAEGYRSRAAYKLLEMNKRYGLITGGMKILDFGCSPGGWSQAALSLGGKNSLVTGVDILDMEPLNSPSHTFIMGDILDESTILQVLDAADHGGYDVILSDAAPNTTGIRITDHCNSVELVNVIYSSLKRLLKRNGSFLFKLFDGEDRNKLLAVLKKDFVKVVVAKPNSSRKSSFEIYICCKGYRFGVEK